MVAAFIIGAISSFATLLDRWLSARRVDVLWAMNFYGMHE